MGENVKLKYNSDLPVPEKSCWGGQLTVFHRKPVNRIYEMINVKIKCHRNK